MTYRNVILAVQVPDLDPTQRVVLIALAERAHKDGSKSFPAVDTISGCCCISHRTAQRALRELEAAGWITKTRGGGGRGLAASYDLALARMEDAVLAPKGVKLTPFPAPETVPNLQETVTDCPEKGVNLTPDQYQITESLSLPSNVAEKLPPGCAEWLAQLQPQPVSWRGELGWYGWDLNKFTACIADKIGIRKQAGASFWSPVEEWIRSGYSFSDIVQNIREQTDEMRSKGRADVVWSLKYFDSRLRRKYKPNHAHRHHTLEELQAKAAKAALAPEPPPSPAKALERIEAERSDRPPPLSPELRRQLLRLPSRMEPEGAPLDRSDRLEEVRRQIRALGLDPDATGYRHPCTVGTP